MKKAIWILLFVCVVSGGAAFRFWRLADRPMHTDEAVHAEKFGSLLEDGFYEYDPHEFHGPTLNYFTLISTCIRGQSSYARIDEVTLRILPAVFGVGLILTPLLFFKGMGKRGALISAVLIAFSPGFIFYSRYYIQEMLLVFFTAVFLGCGWRYFLSAKLRWAIAAGITAGLMHATKETFVFSIAASVAGVLFCRFYDKSDRTIKWSHIFAAITAMAVTSALFFSSFGTNLGGLADSIATYGIWIKRAGGASVHVHPWYYYLDLLTWVEFFEPVTWNEDGLVVFALAGGLLAFSIKGGKRYRLGRFLTVYTLLLVAVYSAMPYKTPWSMMSFVYGMALLGGFAVDRIVSHGDSWPVKSLAWGLVIVFALISPAAQSWFLNFKYSSETTNPYVYGHTSEDIYSMAKSVNKAIDALAPGQDTVVHVVAPDGDYWPWPWYLRDKKNVGYWTQPDNSAPQAAIIIANAKHENKLLEILYSIPAPGKRNMYLPLFEDEKYLRPSVPWRGYIRKDAWDRINAPAKATQQPQKAKPIASITEEENKQIENLQKFSHVAMHTKFEVLVQHDRQEYVGQAVREAFDEVDRLENLLSRFVENSDVSRINLLSHGQETLVDRDTFRCLQTAQKAWELSDGYFDITIGKIIKAFKNGDIEKAQALLSDRPSMDMLQLVEDGFAVRVRGDGVSIDLGGIGKGYAVDKIAEVLGQWGIKRALIHAGSSSVLALDSPKSKAGWPVTLSNPIDGKTIAMLEMKTQVLSCSGLQRGQHIINPFEGKTVADKRACWILMQKNAALADALTTAAMIIGPEKYEQIQSKVPGMMIMALLTKQNRQPELYKLGDWPGL